MKTRQLLVASMALVALTLSACSGNSKNTASAENTEVQTAAVMSVDDLLARGVNQSSTHVDFMVGADDLNIYGVSADGSEVPVFVNGQWAWE